MKRWTRLSSMAFMWQTMRDWKPYKLDVLLWHARYQCHALSKLRFGWAIQSIDIPVIKVRKRISPHERAMYMAAHHNPFFENKTL